MFLLFALGVAASLLVGSMLLMEYGRRLGAEQVARTGNPVTGLGAVESAVFALMGLLLAFAISGGLQRFDERRQLLVQEANAVSSAYGLADLLQDGAKDRIRSELKSYLEARIALFELPVGYSILDGQEIYSHEQQAKIDQHRHQVWEDAVTSCRETPNTVACVLLLPALNRVFEAARLRSGVNERHPPTIVHIMLFGLGLGGSLLAGFGMGASGSRSWLHLLTFASALAVTLYVITDLEFPRVGIIVVGDFDHFLKDVLADMNRGQPAAPPN